MAVATAVTLSTIAPTHMLRGQDTATNSRPQMQDTVTIQTQIEKLEKTKADLERKEAATIINNSVNDASSE